VPPPTRVPQPQPPPPPPPAQPPSATPTPQLVFAPPPPLETVFAPPPPTLQPVQLPPLPLSSPVTATPNPSPTPPVCPTAPPLATRGTRTPTPTPTATPAPGPIACRTPTPLPTPTRKPGVALLPGGQRLLSFDSLSGMWLDRAALAPGAQLAPDASDLHLAVSYPGEFPANADQTVTLVLSRTADGNAHLAVATPNMMRLFPTPGAAGTPGVSIELSQGPDYLVYASAELKAPSFNHVDRSAPQQAEQLLRAGQAPIEWKWSVAGATAGSHTLSLNLELHYKPRSGADVVAFDQPVWDSSVPVEVQPASLLSVPDLAQNAMKGGVGSLTAPLLMWSWTRLRGKLFKQATPAKKPEPRRKQR